MSVDVIRLPIAGHQFAILGPGGAYPVPIPSRMTNGLADLADGGAVIWTGSDTGEVRVTVEVAAEPPPDDRDDQWDDVVEISISANDPVTIGSLATDVSDRLPPFNPLGGPFRVRVYARGRTTGQRGLPGGSAEEYLLVAWPRSVVATSIRKRSSW